MTPGDAVARLDSLRAALAAGDLSGLDGAEAELRLIEAAAASWSAADLVHVRARLHRTQNLFGAAAAGIRSTRRRLEEITAVQQNGGTYGADGRRAAPSAAPARDSRA